MQVGAMNHPAHDVISEIAWMAKLGLDFIDMSLEPPKAGSWSIDWKAVKSELERTGLNAVGHTAYYLPMGSAFEGLRRAAIEELKRCLDVFGRLGVRWMNLHPDRHLPMHDRRYCVDRNLQSLRELLPVANDCGVGLMIENLPGSFNTAAQLADLLDPVPELGLHLDIGHSNLMVERNTSAEILAVYGQRLVHVHLHDNKGGNADLHLPLGTGTVDVAAQVKLLKGCGYDGTITLEVFSPDRHHLEYSRDVLRQLWTGRPSPGSERGIESDCCGHDK